MNSHSEAFAAQVGATGAVLHRCATRAEAATAIVEILATVPASPGGPTLAATGDAEWLLPPGAAAITAEMRPPYLDLGLSSAVLGVAETGSLLLAPRTRWDRLLGILARVHAVAVAERDLCASLDELPPALQRSDAPYLSLVTGPTRTADIERVITVGAHGPAVLHVLLVGDA